MKPLLKLLFKHNSSQGMNIVAVFLGEKIKKHNNNPIGGSGVQLNLCITFSL